MGKIKYASKINLSNQELTEVPSYVFECKNLKTLNLSNNQISEIPRELANLKRLTTLDLSYNKISQIYAKTFDLKELSTLNLNNNQIKSIPKQIANLSRLAKLLLAGNSIEKLPEEIGQLANLKSLNISNNKFTGFPASILKLTNLTHLWISQNNFQEIPTAEIVESLGNLKAIYCYNSVQINVNHNKNLQLLVNQRGNVFNLIKLMTYEDTPQAQKESTTKLIRPRVFISYSHKDDKYKNEVVTTLRGLKNLLPKLEFDFWVDTKIRPGKDWLEEIENALASSSIAIFIVSRDFLASEFIMKTEVPKMLENSEKRGVKILSLIARHSHFKKSPLARFQAINEPSKPLNSLSEHEQDVVYNKLATEVEAYLLS